MTSTLLLTRHGPDAFADRFLRQVGFIEFAGARDPEMSRRLQQAFRRANMDTVKSLRRDAHAEDDTCWLHADDWCLSRVEPPSGRPAQAAT